MARFIRPCGLMQIVQIAVVIIHSEEAGFPIIAALNNVLGNPRQIETGFARHCPPPCG